MYKVVYFCAFLLAYVPNSQSKRELPSFLKICHRYDPHIKECIKSSIEMLQPYMGKGIPEMRIAPMDPLHVTQLALDTGDVKFEYKDLDFYKLNQFDVEHANIDYDSCQANVSFRVPTIYLEAHYKANGHLLVFDLEAEGMVSANFTDVWVFGIVDCKREIIKDKEFAIFHDIDFKVKIGGYHLLLTDLFKNNPELTERTNTVINENSQTLLPEFEPLVSSAVKEIVLSSLRNVFGKFPLDELLPK